MKKSIGLCIVVAICSILVSGCTSIRARDEMRRQDWEIYPGVQRDVTEIGDAFTGKLLQPGWLNGVVAPILLIDLPISAVFETVVMPYDLYRVYNPEVPPKGQR